jgi:pyruvate, water dikinase
MKFVRNFAEIGLKDIPQVGGKNASLGQMIKTLSSLGVKVPRGFATTSDAYHCFLSENHLHDTLNHLLLNLNPDDLTALSAVSQEIQAAILAATLPSLLIDEVTTAYQQLNLQKEQSVAVRSSATVEDLQEASFAGQQETYLNVSGLEGIFIAIKKVYASLFNARAIAYRIHHGFLTNDIAMSVGIQLMVRSDLAVSGVVFTLDTESGNDEMILINASYGLGEMLVQGEVNPDEFIVHKPMLMKNKDAIVSRKLGSKTHKMIYATTAEHTVSIVQVPEEDQFRYALSDKEILLLAKQALMIESAYGKPMDIEWAKDGLNGELYILQARPETVMTHQNKQILEQYSFSHNKPAICQGRSVGQKIGQGLAKVLNNPHEHHNFIAGDVLVADMTDPDWEPLMKKASAIVTNRGGRTCHAAIIAREMGIPAVVGCGNATEVLKAVESITVSCAEGESGFVYEGLLPYQCERTEIKKLPILPMKMCLNVGNPEQALLASRLPNDGVGLARIEFIISHYIGIHPQAILEIETLSENLQQEILIKTAGYSSPREFYIEKLAEGISLIAAAFYPKPVIVRFSDFKSNEYANLLGGSLFEPHEENPMIGYRGTSRYISSTFSACFGLECEAILRVREKKGLTNTQVMFPFVRTMEEAEKVISLTESFGLVRGVNDLQMFMMCEIPSNAILAEDFLELFDGFSIGSNDLTQLTLGLDRDSALVSDLFDERNAAVKSLLHHVIQVCRLKNKYIGICGQAPSDYPDFAGWLMQEGISCISVTPDSIVKTSLILSDLQKNIEKSTKKL